ncbi:c-type cytochrome biogenesis protein CcmI [Paenirhodobacter populi]|uniref:C-type cytochrome biogenesis protein CcmI n=1 Tax=Paenirhodobacter populi TaxID=2306993 RepID=A0A443JJN0_9RHOB|nr:c-type cytochrome biogenesis protein CcmI [Sinirhodobacter populi]RWR20748.1 c-type cytochrome biogenesis protein CcmI [Sinirhodobacter populi]
MLFWIVATALVCVTALLFGLAMLRRRAGRGTARQDLRVYRDQLSEVDRDVARGLLSGDEAERTRIEVSRRMLDADRRAQADAPGGAAPRGVSLAAFGAVLAVLASSVVAYLGLGAPDYPDQPLAGRLAAAEDLYSSRPAQEEAERRAAEARRPAPAADPGYLELMEKLRATVAERPDDETGLALLARNEMALGNYHAGWQAQQRLIAAKGARADAEDYARLGTNMTAAAGGLVTREAEAAFATALAKDPKNGQARYYMGLMLAQNGRGDRAFDLWDALLREGPADAPWQMSIRQNIRALAWLAGEEDYQPPSAPGPSQEDMAAVQALPEAERAQMIRGMVEGLGDRLAREGGTVEDWARLIAALRVLGETDRAARIADEAHQTFAADPQTLHRIDAALSTPAGTVTAPQQEATP